VTGDDRGDERRAEQNSAGKVGREEKGGDERGMKD
jgi:hypothetical protein